MNSLAYTWKKEYHNPCTEKVDYRNLVISRSARHSGRQGRDEVDSGRDAADVEPRLCLLQRTVQSSHGAFQSSTVRLC